MRKIFRTFIILVLLAAVILVAVPVVREYFDLSPSYKYERSEKQSNDMSALELSSPNSKNSEDLVAFVLHAWENGWGYVWGTFGYVLDESGLADRALRYPGAVAANMGFIEKNWLGYRAADCSGLIKAYGWYEPDIQGINYGANGFPDWDANTMFEMAQESGSIDTIPEIPGIAVWCDGHIGIYIGDGLIVEAMGTEYGVVKTQLSGYTGSRWTHWLKLEGITYP